MTALEKKVGDGTCLNEHFEADPVNVVLAIDQPSANGETFEVAHKTDGTNVSEVVEHQVLGTELDKPQHASVTVFTPSPHRRIYLAQGAGFTVVGGIAVRMGLLTSTADATFDWGSAIDLAGGKTDPDYVVDGVVMGALVGEFTDDDEQSTVRQVYMERNSELFYYYKD
jgi:hypothetical protein